jgi:hypothetical protein
MAAYAPLGGLPQAQALGQQGALQSQQVNQNALAEYTKAAQEKQQTALLQQQTQAAAQENQIRQQQMKDQDALTKTITQYDPSQHSISDIPKMVTANGGSGQAALQAQQGLIAQRKNLASLSDEQFAEEQKKADLIQGVHDQVSQAAPEQKQDVYSRGLTSLQNAGVDVSKEPLQYPGDDVFAQHLPAIRLHSAIVAEAEKDRELSAKEQEAQAKEQTANQGNYEVVPALGVRVNKTTGETTPINGAALSPQMMEGKYVALAQKKAANQPLSADDAAFMKGYEKYKTLVPTATVNLQAGLLNPQAKQMAADLYTQTGQLPAGMRSPAMSAGILNQAAGAPGTQAPNIAQNKMNYGAATALQKSATSGDMAKNITSFNTAIAHASQLKEAADALDDGDVHLLNALGNQMGYQFGSDKTTNFNVIKNALSGEISKVFKGGEATDAEIKAVQEPFSAANSPVQLKGAIDNAIHLMNSKRDALKDQYTQGMKGQPNFGGENGGVQHVAGGQAQGLNEGATGTGSDGKKYVVKNGVWAPQ